MEHISIDNILDVEEVKRFLKKLFPELHVFYYDFNDEPPADKDLDNGDAIFFNYSINNDRSEFKVDLCIYRTPVVDEEQRALYIAQKISDHFSIRTLVAISDPIHENPYLNIVFKNSKTYLVDDSLVDWTGETNGHLQFIMEYKLKDSLFDKKAQIVEAPSNSFLFSPRL